MIYGIGILLLLCLGYHILKLVCVGLYVFLKWIFIDVWKKEINLENQ